MTQTADNHLFTLERPTDLPTFQIYDKRFHAGAATGGELELLQSLSGADESVDGLKKQCATLTAFLAKREVGAAEPLPENWIWDTLPTDQIAQLAEQLVKAFEKQWGNRASRRKAKAA